DAPAARLGHGCRGLERTVATSDHEYLLTDVLFRVDETINNLWQFFTGHVQLARRAAPADREQHGTGAILRARGLHEKGAAFACDVFYALPVVDLHSGLALGFLPELEQRLLARLPEIDLADERYGCRSGHHELAARILEDAATE